MGYFDQYHIRKKRRLSDEEQEYIDCSFLVATSNTVETLFSTAKHILTDLRKAMSPIMFEAILFLKINRGYWDLPMVASAMKSDNKQEVRDYDVYYRQ